MGISIGQGCANPAGWLTIPTGEITAWAARPICAMLVDETVQCSCEYAPEFHGCSDRLEITASKFIQEETLTPVRKGHAQSDQVFLGFAFGR